MANLLYLDTLAVDDGASLRGGALVVDDSTEPLEFRCTSVVRPTALQKILWGARLDAHIRAALIGKPLLQQTQKEYAVVLVRDVNLLELREHVQVPVIQLRRDADIEFEAPPEDSTEGSEGRGVSSNDEEGSGSSAVLSHALGRFEQVALVCDPLYKADRETARDILKPVFERRDVMEPFERVRTALEMVHAQESKKATR
jgi:hypothetical protein